MTAEHHHVAIVGAGFSGIGAVIALRRAGFDDLVVFERASGLGGTWWDNTYPGCQCDVPSHLYSFSFAPNPEWSRTFSLQPEIRDYLQRTAEAHDVLRHVRFEDPVEEARWDGTAQRWVLRTASGTTTADVLVLGNGPLSAPKLPNVPGIERFRGATFHSARWDHGHDLRGKRVAVVGTGASAIQLVPEIQPIVGELLVFQRTPPWVIPHSDRPIRPGERWVYRNVPGAQRLNRLGVYWSRELLLLGFAKHVRLMRVVAHLARRHLAKQVPDPALRAMLTPGYLPGCKRLLPSDRWYPALQQPNVTVIPQGLTEVREGSVVAADGSEHAVDTLIFATGFHVTDHPTMAHVYGADGRSLAQVWSETGMQHYKGTTAPGFPNLFCLAGANTGIGTTSLVVMIEAQLAYLVDALRWMARTRVRAIDVRDEAFVAWNADVQSRLAGTVWSTGGCTSWYLDAHGRNPTLWPDYTWRFCLLTRRFDPEVYEVVEAAV